MNILLPKKVCVWSFISRGMHVFKEKNVRETSREKHHSEIKITEGQLHMTETMLNNMNQLLRDVSLNWSAFYKGMLHISPVHTVNEIKEIARYFYLKISDQLQSLEKKASIVDRFVAWPLDDAQAEADTQASGSNKKDSSRDDLSQMKDVSDPCLREAIMKRRKYLRHKSKNKGKISFC